MAITRKRMARKRSLLLAARGDLQEVPGETHNQESEKKCRPQPSTLTLTLFISNITVTIVILLLQQDFSQLVLQQTSKCLWRKCRGMPSRRTVALQSGHLLSNSLGGLRSHASASPKHSQMACCSMCKGTCQPSCTSECDFSLTISV